MHLHAGTQAAWRTTLWSVVISEGGEGQGEDNVVHCTMALTVYAWKSHRALLLTCHWEKQVTCLHSTSKGEEVQSYQVFRKVVHTWWTEPSRMMRTAMKEKSQVRRQCLGRWFLLDIDGQEKSLWQGDM